MSGLDDVDPDSPVGTIIGALVDGDAMAVVRHRDGWVMVPDLCPHAACPFTDDGEVFDAAVLACNCHGSEFDVRTGELLLGPAARGLTVVALQVRDGRLSR